MVTDSNGKPIPAESVLQLREANLKHHDDLRDSESSDDEGDGGGDDKASDDISEVV